MGVSLTLIIKALVKVLVAIIGVNLVTTLAKIDPCIQQSVSNGIMILVIMGKIAVNCMSVGYVLKQVRWESSIRPLPNPMIMLRPGLGRIMGFSSSSASLLSAGGWGPRWSTADFIEAHITVKESGKFNFEGCRIPIPTAIRYDRIEEALGGDIPPKELRVLDLLKYGMPIDCNPKYGIGKKQKNHFSAVCHREAIGKYLNVNLQCQAILGPFKLSPIEGLCFSPLMTVPKKVDKR